MDVISILDDFAIIVCFSPSKKTEKLYILDILLIRNHIDIHHYNPVIQGRSEITSELSKKKVEFTHCVCVFKFFLLIF